MGRWKYPISHYYDSVRREFGPIREVVDPRQSLNQYKVVASERAKRFVQEVIRAVDPDHGAEILQDLVLHIRSIQVIPNKATCVEHASSIVGRWKLEICMNTEHRNQLIRSIAFYVFRAPKKRR